MAYSWKPMIIVIRSRMLIRGKLMQTDSLVAQQIEINNTF